MSLNPLGQEGDPLTPQVNPGTTPGATPGVSWVENFSCRCRGTTKTPQNTTGRQGWDGHLERAERAAQLIPASKSRRLPRYPRGERVSGRGDTCPKPVSRVKIARARSGGPLWTWGGVCGAVMGAKAPLVWGPARHPKTVGERGGFRGLGVRGPLGDQARPHRGEQGLLVPKTPPLGELRGG